MAVDKLVSIGLGISFFVVVFIIQCVAFIHSFSRSFPLKKRVVEKREKSRDVFLAMRKRKIKTFTTASTHIIWNAPHLLCSISRLRDPSPSPLDTIMYASILPYDSNDAYPNIFSP